MHPRNRHQERYDLQALSKVQPQLRSKIITTKFGEESLDFSDAASVKLLNQALLKFYYDVDWDIPNQFLSPPIPGRADYIHYLADLLGSKKGARVLDIGVGANCIYPIIGVHEYQWTFVGTDINPAALSVARSMIEQNPTLSSKVELRLQKSGSIFNGIFKSADKFDLTMCNPPFHASAAEAEAGTLRKWRNLGKKLTATARNFGGSDQELWTPGGELSFIKQMIKESKAHAPQVGWFTCLVSKEDNLKALEQTCHNVGAKFQLIDMTQGSKKSRILCWRFN